MVNLCLRFFVRGPILLLGLAALGVAALSSCGGGSSAPPSAPPPPTSAITSVTVSPGTANLFVKANQQFTVNVQGTGGFSSTVTWVVNDLQGGNATVGTITSSGLYTAPSAVPSPANVTIKAQSVQDATKVGSAALTVNPEKVQSVYRLPPGRFSWESRCSSPLTSRVLRILLCSGASTISLVDKLASVLSIKMAFIPPPSTCRPIQ